MSILVKIHFIQRGIDVQKQIDETINEKIHNYHIFKHESPLPEIKKISLKLLDVKFYPLEPYKEIPLSKEKMVEFDVVKQITDFESGDVDVFVYAKYY